jgi:predicted O-methyltransferase YrrM
MTESRELGQLRELTANVHGWLSPDEGALLFHLARACTGRGVIVEIGSWKGKSTIWLARGDPHTGAPEQQAAYGKVWTFHEFEQNIKNAGVESLVRPLVATSADAARDFHEPIELLFVDGAHEYEAVRLDFELWFPKLIPGGTIAFHDVKKPGPKRLIRERVLGSPEIIDVGFADTILHARKVERASLAARCWSRTAFARRRMRRQLARLGPGVGPAA